MGVIGSKWIIKCKFSNLNISIPFFDLISRPKAVITSFLKALTDQVVDGLLANFISGVVLTEGRREGNWIVF